MKLSDAGKRYFLHDKASASQRGQGLHAAHVRHCLGSLLACASAVPAYDCVTRLQLTSSAWLGMLGADELWTHCCSAVICNSSSSSMSRVQLVLMLDGLQELSAWALLGEVCGVVKTEAEVANDWAQQTGDAAVAWLMDQTASRRTGQILYTPCHHSSHVSILKPAWLCAKL